MRYVLYPDHLVLSQIILAWQSQHRPKPGHVQRLQAHLSNSLTPVGTLFQAIIYPHLRLHRDHPQTDRLAIAVAHFAARTRSAVLNRILRP
jgi:hypothetical protein